MSTSDTFIGRENALRQLREAAETHDVVWVVGAPGIGKSRLTRETFAGAMIVDADEYTNAEELLALVEDATGTIVVDGFDRFMHVQDAVTERSAATLIMTSRERPGGGFGAVIELAPLPTAHARALFLDRASASFSDFHLSDHKVLDDLVEALDRNPLAIELAAARARTFGPADLLERLDQRFRLLVDRHQGVSLEDRIGESWALLDDVQRSCLAQCASFHGFDLSAAEAVVHLEDDWVPDVLERLIDKSLIQRSADGARFSLSHSLRAFAARHGDDPAVQRHAVYYLEFAARLLGTGVAAALDRLEPEVENLASIVDRHEETNPVLAARAAYLAGRILAHRGAPQRRAALFERGVGAAEVAGDDELLVQNLMARADSLAAAGRLDESGADARRALEHARPEFADDVSLRAAVLVAEVERRTGTPKSAAARLESLFAGAQNDATVRYVGAHLAGCRADLGDLEGARRLAMQLPATRSLSDPAMEYAVLKRLAYAHYYLGHHEHQERLNERALTLAESIGDPRRVASSLQGLGDAAFARGDYDAVKELYRRALELHRELGNDHLEAVLLGNLGSAEHRTGALDAAADHYQQSLELHRQVGALPYEAVVTYACAVLEHEQGKLDDAAFRYDRALELFEQLQQDDDVVGTLLCRSWLEFGRGDLDTSASFLRRADDLVTESWQPVVDATRALLDADTQNMPEVSNGGFAALLTRGIGAIVAGNAVPDREELSRTLQGRLVLRLSDEADIVEGQRPRAPKRAERRVDEGPDLRVADGGDWFQVPGGEEVNLRRRRAHRLVVDRLAAMHTNTPGEALDVYDMFDVGWPGETATPETAAERVYWVVGTLRKLGLEDLLLTSDAGYYLSPNASVERVQKE